MSLDAYARPPESIRLLFKKWQKSSLTDIDISNEIINLSEPTNRFNSQVRKSAELPKEKITQLLEEFVVAQDFKGVEDVHSKCFEYELIALPGLFIYPSLLSSQAQIILLDRLLHRDLSNPSHKSNLHLHYEIPYIRHDDDDDDDGSLPERKSFFLANQADVLQPRDPSMHKPLTIKQMLERKLRWITLGGQYDWTAKIYPRETPPQFPEDIAHLLKGLFPNVDAQAAIVNFYTPGDTLSVHRDVSEECDRDLISISFGCDGLFVVGNEDGSKLATLRLKSGDVVLMSGTSRYAWHAVPKILAGTCPSWLHSWPAKLSVTTFESWSGWMSNKRINLNVRQMRA